MHAAAGSNSDEDFVSVCKLGSVKCDSFHRDSTIAQCMHGSLFIMGTMTGIRARTLASCFENLDQLCQTLQQQLHRAGKALQVVHLFTSIAHHFDSRPGTSCRTPACPSEANYDLKRRACSFTLLISMRCFVYRLNVVSPRTSVAAAARQRH
jgi:hypothetical protein